MSVTCVKEFTIQIGTSLPDPFYYYKLDSFSEPTVPESVAGRDLTRTLGSAVALSIVTGKINSAYKYDTSGSFRAERTNADADFQGLDMTLRLWLFPPSNSNITLLAIASASFNNFFALINSTAGSTMIARARFNGGANVDVGDNLIPNQWNHVIAWHRQGVEIGLRINNGTPVTTPFVTGLNATGLVWFNFPGNGVVADRQSIDELSIWKGQALTTAEQDADWNSGNGLTYPFP